MPENPPQPDPDETPERPLSQGDPLGEGDAAGGDAPPPPPPPEGAAAPPPQQPRRLTRSTTDRVIGGVSGGLGRYFGVDPILFRLAFVVLTFAGGVGLLAYIGLLVFVPADDRAPTGTPSRDTNVIAAVVLVVLTVLILGPPAFFLGPVLLPIALLIGIGLLLWRAAGGSPPASGDTGRLVGRAAIALLIGIAAVGGFVAVFAIAAMGGGTVLAVLAIVAGVALVVTAFTGGARWLIVPALVLVLPLAIVAAADIDVEGGVGERHYRPASTTELQPDYRLGMGELIVDLRDVDLPEERRTDLHVEMGVGHTIVRVPEDACVSSDVKIGAGHVAMIDRESDGVDVDFVQSASSDRGAPQLHIDADIGVGAIHVRRGNEPLFSRGRFDGSDEVACP